GFGHGDGPVRRAAHHHALEDRLSSDRLGHGSLCAAGAAGLLEPPLEALDPSAAVQELLLPGVERVAGGADLDVQLGLRRARLEGVPAGAGHLREHVFGMDAGLHCAARIAAAVSGATFPPETTRATVEPSSSSTTRASGLAPFTAAAIPETRPPPPTGTTTTSTSGTSSTISSPTVPWPAITSGSSYGWTRVRPVSSISSSSRTNAAGMSGA